MVKIITRMKGMCKQGYDSHYIHTRGHWLCLLVPRYKFGLVPKKGVENE